ncbi:hypothetical protein AAZV13_13G032250 [Glycine max]
MILLVFTIKHTSITRFSYFVTKKIKITLEHESTALSNGETLVTFKTITSLDFVTWVKMWIKLCFNQHQTLTFSQLLDVLLTERMRCLVGNMNFSTFMKHVLSIVQKFTH